MVPAQWSGHKSRPLANWWLNLNGSCRLTRRLPGLRTASHEVAHEWFYGLVGNDQGRDPWLDEAFATYAEALVRGTGGTYAATAIPTVGRNRVGRPMTFW